VNLYEAFMKAADHIESRPHLFNFDLYEMPGTCNTPGCALGWVGFFSGLEFSHQGFIGVRTDVSPQMLGIRSTEFYDRMAEWGLNWMRDASCCARSLRLYAEKYHAPAKPERNFARELEQKLLAHPLELA
jgi:hypothetical protein